MLEKFLKLEKEYKDFLRLNQEYSLIEKNDKIIVGFSGGPDSVFLVEMLKKFKVKIDFEFFLVHINHLLRGEDADSDEEFSKNYAEKNNLKIFSKRINIEKLAQENKKSLEEIGREERYKFFEEVAEKVGANKIATAHNKDDQIETFLFKLMRGTSLQGLEGIKVKTKIKDLDLIRPISEIYKKDILNYLNKNEIQYKIDKTNFENEFTRNSIRLDLIPFIEKRYNLKFKDKIFSLIEEIRENNKNNEILLEDYISGEKIVLEKLKKESSFNINKILMTYLNNFNIDISRVKIEKIKELLNKDGTKKLDLNFTYRIVKDYKFLYLEEKIENKITEKEQILEIPSQVKFGNYKISVKELEENFEQNKITDKYTYLLETSKTVVLKVRTRREGDKIKLLGEGGTKKVKKIFIDKKVEKDKRDKVPVLLADEQIFWLVGVKKGQLSLEKKDEKIELKKILIFVEEVKVERQ